MTSFVHIGYWVGMIYLAILYPIQATYCCWRFHKHRHKQYFIHRNPPLLISFIILYTIRNYFSFLPMILNLGFHVNIPINWDILYNTGYAIVIPIVLVSALRYFHLLIKIRHTQQSKQWRSLLNDQNKKHKSACLKSIY